MKHAINLITYELETQIEAESRKSRALADTQRRYDEMCAKHAKEIKPLVDALAQHESELAHIRDVKADYQAAKNMLEGKL